MTRRREGHEEIALLQGLGRLEPREILREYELARLAVPAGGLEPDGEPLAQPQRRVRDVGLEELDEGLVGEAGGEVGLVLGEEEELGALRIRVVEIDEVVLGLTDHLPEIGVEGGLVLELPDVELGIEGRALEPAERVVEAEVGLELAGEGRCPILPELGDDGVVVGGGLAGRGLGGGEGYGREGRDEQQKSLFHGSPCVSMVIVVPPGRIVKCGRGSAMRDALAGGAAIAGGRSGR